MKWNSPELGDKRKVKRFAWIPTYCGNGLTIWLEWYIAEQKYYRFYDGCRWFTEEITPIIKQRQ